MPKEYIMEKTRHVEFHRDNFRRMSWIAIILSIISIGLTVLIIKQYLELPDTNYFATTSDGNIIELTPE